MKCWLWLLISMGMLSFGTAQETRFFEMRVYYAAPEKLGDLQARFRDHTKALFEKHGIQNLGYWLPLTNTENRLIYLLAYPSREAREKSWKEFGADPAWQEVARASEKNGKLVAKVESIYLQPTDFSPAVKPERSDPPRVYELRIYQATPGKLDALLARFRDHTMALFKQHSMEQFGYFVPTEKKDGAGEKLIYILSHKNKQAQEASFKDFRADPEWLKVKADSEANGSLTIKDGVQSTLMAPTDFSPAQ